ncbi:MAG: hypothetical protein ACRD43_05850 [Pyrinomonadaceae bacterium]
MIVALMMFAAFAFSAYAQTNTPVAATRSFYKYDRSHSQVFNRRDIDARKAWFSPELFRLFQYELRREAAYLKKNPTDKPYFGDGLPFQPIDETCKAGRQDLHKSLVVKPAFQKGNRAAVTATFAFPKPCKDPDNTIYTIGLIKSKKGWVIDDVNFGEDRTLKEDLKRKDY